LPNRAAISTNGTTWNQTPPAERKNRTATYRIPAPAATLWLAWGPPFSRGDAVEFCESMAGRYSFVSSFSLVHSTEGRSVPALRIAEGETNASQRAGIWILARQHAWEAGGTWVGIGIAEWLASNDPRAQSMRRNAEFFFVPVMDPDHVATGDGGKECLPQDQNRDWSDAPHWPEVAAVQKHVRSLVKEGRMDLLIDLHNPGAAAREVDLWITPTNLLGAVQGRNQTKLFAAIRAEVTSPIRAKAEPHWDGPSPDHPATWHTLSCPWVYEHGNPHTVAITVETPWNMPAGTTTGYREVGRKLGLAIERYLRERERR
jgi:hypothetical protein